MYDLIIRNAKIIDGSGKEPIFGDLAIEGERIAELGKVGGESRAEVNAQGQCLCPGFIDVHSHDDFAALQSPELPWKVQQGATSVIVGNCGIGAAPWPAAQDWHQKLHPNAEPMPYADYHGYFAALDAASPSLNVAVLAGHGALRNHAAPRAKRELNSEEQTRLGAALEEALDAGVIGMSAGLIYEPGIYANEAELVELCRRLLGRSPIFTVHLRSEANALLDAVKEALSISEQAGVGLQLSHHKAHGRNNWGAVHNSLALVDEARERGQDVWLDQYPYTAGSTILQAVMDRGGLAGGPTLGELFPEDIVIASCAGSPDFEGKNLRQLAEKLGKTAQAAAEEVLKRDPGAWVVVHAMSEEDVMSVMRHPATLIGSDGLPTESGRPHPRLWGTFPRVLSRYVRETSTLSLTQAVHKMTALAARRFALKDRGELKQGYYADLVLFDALTVEPGANYEEPRLAPRGIEGVWVNGTRVVQAGQHTHARPGRALRASA